MVFDTNVLIYISKNVLKVKEFLSKDALPKISVISDIEAMGFNFASADEKAYMTQICNSCEVLKLDNNIVKATINLRTKSRLKLPDAIIYATAAVHGIPLLTNNINDFKALGDSVELVNLFLL